MRSRLKSFLIAGLVALFAVDLLLVSSCVTGMAPLRPIIGIYNWMRDWQTLIAGVIALGGGGLAYRATTSQSRSLRNDDRRRVARESLRSTRLPSSSEQQAI
jgi:hypothetical protein